MPPGIRQTGMVPLELFGGARVVLEARDPTTGAELGGVDVTSITLYAGPVGGDSGPLDDSALAVWLQPTSV